MGLFALALSGWFYKDNKSSQTSLIVGESSVIHLNGTQTGLMTFMLDGSFLGGEKIKQNISVKNDSEEDLYLRAKLTIFAGNNKDPRIELNTSENWTKAEDGYYYFDGFVESMNTVGVLSSLQISSEDQISSGTDYILVVSVEGLSTEFDRNLVWGM